VDRRQIRRRCREHVTALEHKLGGRRPLDLDAVLELASLQRGRPVRLLPATMAVGSCGVWVVTDRGDYVFYEQSTSPLHHRHIILHELSHVLCGHGGGESATALAPLVPDLSAEVVERVMNRTSYSDAEEQEAEVLATLLLERVAAVPAVHAWRPDLDAPTLLKWS
jgi:hypothetical protein